jgi:hypothetical protein
MRISTVCVLQESKRIAQEDNIKDFKAYPSWVFGFMKRNNLSVRFSNKKKKKLPSDWEAKVAKFRLYLRENLFEAVSGDSDYVHDDSFSEMEAEEIPKEILNATDSLNVESDEEFLGFE